MAGEKRFTRIPPESSGDRVYMVHAAEIEFANGGNRVDATYGNHIWQIGERYDVEFFGKVHVHAAYDRGDGTGILSVHYNLSAKMENNEIGDNLGRLISIDGVNVGEVISAYDVYIPAQHIMGYDNPDYGLDVDAYGSAQITFDEGAPQLDAFGKLRTSGATHLGEYVYSSPDELYENYSLTYLNRGSRSVRTAAIEHDNVGKYIEVKVKTEQDFAAATSNTYHHYIPGSSHLFMGTMLVDSLAAGPLSITNHGNSGCERSFGMFDAQNGMMFTVGPTGVLYLVRRSSVSGTKKDYILASSDTADGLPNFNGDLVNGSRGAANKSQLNLDVTKDNIYWIDVQWHGAGRIRFGTFYQGRRVVIHEYYHGNTYTEPMTQTASLPVCHFNSYLSDSEMQDHAVYGDGSGTGGGYGSLPAGLVRLGLTESRPSDANFVYIRSYSGSVWTEVDINLQSLGRPKVYTTGHLPVDGIGFRPLFTLSPSELLADGTSVDHSIFIPTKITAYAYDNAASVDTGSGANRDAIVHFRVGVNSVHSGHEFTRIPGTNFEVSTTGTSFEDTNKPGNTRKIEFEDMFNGQFTDVLTDRYINLQYGSYKNSPDDGGIAEHIVTGIQNNIPTAGVGAAVDAVGNSTTLLLDDQDITLTTDGELSAYGTELTVTDASGVVVGGGIIAIDAGNTPYTADGTTVLAVVGNVITLSKNIQNTALPTATSVTHTKLIEGAAITGPNITADTAIKKVVSGTEVTLSQATTGTFAGTETFTMTRPAVVTIDPADAGNKPQISDRWVLREPETATFPLNISVADGALHLHGVSGTGTNPFPRTCFIKIVSLTKAYLYADRNLTQPIDTTAFTYGSGGVIHGFVGSRITFTFFGHEQIKNFSDPRVMFSIAWKEIVQ